jgi:hypothetical protein
MPRHVDWQDWIRKSGRRSGLPMPRHVDWQDWTRRSERRNVYEMPKLEKFVEKIQTSAYLISRKR